MEILYCKKWWTKRKKAIDIVDEKTAMDMHTKGLEYCVVLSESKKINYILQISKNDIFVNFYNDYQEKYLTYAFHRVNAEKLFLNAAYFHNYLDCKEIETITFSFNTDGELLIEKRNGITGDIEEKEKNVNVDCNWEQYPVFGQYNDLIQVERVQNTKII